MREIPARRTYFERKFAPLFTFAHEPGRFCGGWGIAFSDHLRKLHREVVVALWNRATKPTKVAYLVTRVRLTEVPPSAVPVIGEWLERTGKLPLRDLHVLPVDGVLKMEWAAKKTMKESAKKHRLLGSDAVRLKTEEGDLSSLRAHLRVSGFERVVVAPQWQYPVEVWEGSPVPREQRANWLALLRRLPSQERPALRPVLETMDLSRDWLWAVCDHCQRRFTVRWKRVKDCYPCRRRPAKDRWVARQHRMGTRKRRAGSGRRWQRRAVNETLHT